MRSAYLKALHDWLNIGREALEHAEPGDERSPAERLHDALHEAGDPVQAADLAEMERERVEHKRAA